MSGNSSTETNAAEINRESFYTILQKYKVLIPVIQRDYAQGRDSASEIRSEFLDELYDYVTCGKRSNDLDFIYGNIEKNEADGKNILILLDGQQRVTTLFLLHWYAAVIGKNGTFDAFKTLLLDGTHSKFTYATRYSSTDFCDFLVKFKPKGIDERPLSEVIQDEKDFNAHWSEDPTVISMLNMLDSIQKVFKKDEFQNLYETLTGLDGNAPAVTFQFLNLDANKLTDELYIKMNSRGRPLTRYENLKSKLLNEYGKLGKAVRENTARKFDMDWTDFLWNIWLKNKKIFPSPVVDEMFLSLISNLCISENILYQVKEQKEATSEDFAGIAKKTEKLIAKKNKIEYKDLLTFFTQDENSLLKDFPQIMEFLLADKSEEKILQKILYDFSDGASYHDKLFFFCHYKYFLIYKKTDAEFSDWLKFSENVLNNSEIDNSKDFVNAINSMNSILLSSKGNIRNYLITEDFKEIPTAGLYRQQVEEEKIKAILSVSEDWKAAVDQAEQEIQYLKGELNFPLKFFAGVSLGTVSEDCRAGEKLALFKEAASKMGIIFGKSGCTCTTSLSRALLSKGNYLKPMGRNKKTLSFLITDGGKARDLSWKTYLGDERDENTPRRAYFSELLKDLPENFSKENMKETFEAICKNALSDQSHPLEKWRRAFISTPEIFEGAHLGEKYRYIEKDSDDEIYVLVSNNRGKYHSELFSLEKYYELKKDFAFSPFKIEYLSYMGKDAELGFYFEDLPEHDSEKCKCKLLCEYTGEENYSLCFWNENTGSYGNISEDLRKILEEKGFSDEKNKNVFYKKNIQENNLEAEIKNLLSTL